MVNMGTPTKFKVTTTWKDKDAMRIYYERERSLYDRDNTIISAESRAEKKVKLEIANSLVDVLDDETISIKMGLNIDDIKSLRVK